MDYSEARVDWHIYIDCPECLISFDLAEHDEAGQFSVLLFSDDPDELENSEVTCPECKTVFGINNVLFPERL